MEKRKSEYKGVYPQISQGRDIYWIAKKIDNKKKYQKTFKTEREAALGYDKMCLSLGLEPENILKKKSKTLPV